MPLEQFELRLSTARSLGPGIRHLEFERTDGKSLGFVPGQFITLLLKNEAGEIKRRSYSIANPPSESTLSIAISYLKGGIASETLFNLEDGETVKGMGPAGRLVLQEEKVARYLLIGTGTGIAPYRAMLPELKKRLSTTRVEIILGVQYRQGALYAEDFLQFSKDHPNCGFHLCLSREEQDFHPHERRGHVQSTFADLALNPAEDIVYLCGNPNMIDDSFKHLTEMGFPSDRVRREKYISSN